MSTSMVLAGDSRLRDLLSIPMQNTELYSSRAIVKRGGGIREITDSIVDEIKTYNDPDLVVIYFAGGICDITKK